MKALSQKLGLTFHPTCLYYLCVGELSNFSSEDAGNPKDLEKKLEFGTNGLLQEWSAIPKYPSTAHIPILQQLELKYEFVEGIYMLKKLEEDLAGNKPPNETMENINRWRRRGVSQQDSPKMWGSLLKTRKIIFKHMGTIGQRYPNHITSNDLVSLQDTAWTDITHARLLRKSGILHKSVNILENLSNEDNQSESFILSCEKVKLCLAAGDYENALNLARYYADTFKDQQQSEFKRLKGKIYTRMDNIDVEKAKSCFSNAASVSPKYNKIWLSWAELVDRGYVETKSHELATQAMVSYLLGIQTNLQKYRLYIPKILLLLENCHDPNQFEEHSEKLSLSLVSNWIHQLLYGLYRNNSDAIYKLLLRIATYKPQPLFYHLRTFILEIKEHDSTSPSEIQAERLKLPIQLMSELKKKHPLLVQTLEMLCQNLSQNLKVTIEEDFYNVISNLLFSTFQHSEEITEENLQEIFEMIDERFFNREGADDFIDKYHEDFLNFFNENTYGNLKQVQINLKKWKDRLASDVKLSEYRYLDQECLDLSTFYTKEIEIPGTDKIILERFLPKIQPIKGKNSNRAVSLRGSNGKDYTFMIAVKSHTSHSSYRLYQIMKNLNQCFIVNSHKISHRLQGSNFEIQEQIPIDSRHSLVEMRPGSISLNEIYNLTVDEIGIDSDLWIFEENESLVTEHLLSSYIQRCLQSPDRYAIFTKQFTAQWGLLYVLSNLLRIPINQQLLSKLWIAKTTGTLQLGFSEFSLLNNERDCLGVRLTPNIKYLIGEAGIKGIMPAVISNVMKLILKEKSQILPLLEYILREEEHFEINSIVSVCQENSNIEKIQQKLEDSIQESSRLRAIRWF